MAHTKPEDLKDLKAELDQVRALDNLKERSAGIFYFKSIPFLHFHDNGGDRCADIKIDGEWRRVPVGFNATPSIRSKFLAHVRQAHARLAPKSVDRASATKLRLTQAKPRPKKAPR